MENAQSIVAAIPKPISSAKNRPDKRYFDRASEIAMNGREDQPSAIAEPERGIWLVIA